VTPSGLEIYYQSKPKRLYRVRDGRSNEGCEELGGVCDCDERLCAQWVEVPSVTTVLDIIEKGGLSWWGWKIGVESVMELVRRGLLAIGEDANGVRHLVHTQGPHAGHIATQEQVIELAKLNKLTSNDVRDDAGKRGVDVHDALEVWAATGTPPVPEKFPPEQRGYVVGLNAFLVDLGESVEPEGFEIMVASLVHRFAGRYDLRLRLKEPRRVVTKITDSRQPRYMKYATVPAGVGLLDLKTSKGIYSTHPIQLEAYELASVEDGHEPTSWRGVLHVTSDGYYELAPSRVSAEEFIAIRGAYDALKFAESTLTATARAGK
jgi:hypothetical protein